jgi:hypothetical protein
MAAAVKRSKRQYQEGRDRIGQILLREWDPVEIDTSGPADEYESYADQVYSMLVDDRATASAIAAYLLKAAVKDMGLANRERLPRKVTASLCFWSASAPSSTLAERRTLVGTVVANGQ